MCEWPARCTKEQHHESPDFGCVGDARAWACDRYDCRAEWEFDHPTGQSVPDTPGLTAIVKLRLTIVDDAGLNRQPGTTDYAAGAGATATDPAGADWSP